jgi:hypothetical protein
MTTHTRHVVGRWQGMAATEMVWAVDATTAGIVVEIDTADPMPAESWPCAPFARVRATPDQLRELVRLAGRVLEVVERHEAAATATGGPGWPGPCPDGMTWERWLANNNVD